MKWLSSMQVAPKDSVPLTKGNPFEIDSNLSVIAEIACHILSSEKTDANNNKTKLLLTSSEKLIQQQLYSEQKSQDLHLPKTNRHFQLFILLSIIVVSLLSIVVIFLIYNNKSGIQPEYLDIFVEHRFTKKALNEFYETIEYRGVPTEDVYDTLKIIAKKYNSFKEEIATYKDPVDSRLQNKIIHAVNDLNDNDIKLLLNKAREKSLRAITNDHNEINKQKQISAANRLSQLAQWNEINLDYKQAAIHYKKAIDQLPEGTDKLKAKYLKKWGDACYNAHDYSIAIKALEK